MKKTLIITAHPQKRSFTHTIAAHYKKTFELSGGKTQVINLYAKTWMQNYCDLSADEKSRDFKLCVKIQAEIKKADEIVFVFPIWWGDAPAVLKNFLDCNFTGDFAFEYKNGKAHGLLKNKTARIFTTCDGPGFVYKLVTKPLWSKGRLGFCGIKLKTFDILDKKRFRKDAELQAFIALVGKRASEK